MNPGTVARRTSPLVVLVHTITFRQARQFVPAVIPLVAATGLGGGTTTVVALVVGVTLLSLATAALSWWRFSYADGPTSVVVTRGLVSRSVRTVPNDRIRGVEVEAPALHRSSAWCGCGSTRRPARSTGNGEELVIDGLPRAEGDRLRTAVLTHRATAAPAGDGEPAARTGGGGVRPLRQPLAVLRPAGRQLPRGARWPLSVRCSGWSTSCPAGSGRISTAPTSPTAGLRRSCWSSPWSCSLRAPSIGAAVVNWGFRLTRRGGSLIATRGLITRRHTELEIDRIRGWTLSEGLGMRWVRAARLSALVTGLGDATRRGQLLPLGPRAEAWALGRRLVGDPGTLTAHPPAARRRRIVRALAGGLLVTLAGVVATATAGWWGVLVAGLALTALGVPIGLGRYASLGHATGAGSFTVRSGWLVREQAVLQRRAVVGWQVQQSYFQRRAGLATVLACVGAGRGGYAAIDVGADEVADFTAAASEDWARTFRG